MIYLYSFKQNKLVSYPPGGDTSFIKQNAKLVNIKDNAKIERVMPLLGNFLMI
jgi:hypothetical protein